MYGHIKCPCRELQELREEVKRLRWELNVTRGYIHFNGEEYALAAYMESVRDENAGTTD